MIKIEAKTLEEAYSNASETLKCSVTELVVEIVQQPNNGILGLFKKSAIIVATKKNLVIETKEEKVKTVEQKVDKEIDIEEDSTKDVKIEKKTKKEKHKKKVHNNSKKESQQVLNDTIMPTSFVSTQDEEDEEDDISSYLADYDDTEDNHEIAEDLNTIVTEVEVEINKLFDFTCFKIDKIAVSAYDENTLLIEFQGDDAALLIGKEGYRYKALSYMLFNWINTRYQLQLRLEIAEFLKNQEESVSRYLEGVYENIDRDGKAQTKILDGVLVQIALNELRDKYPDKYIVIRSTRDGFKYIIINDYYSNKN